MEEEQARAEEPVLRNTVTLLLDGSAEQVLRNYRASVAHFRGWNRKKGIRVDVSNLFGAAREVYTTPASGTFYFVVRYLDRSLVFVIQARTLWLTGYINANGGYEMVSNEQTVHYMDSPLSRWLSFKGNHRHISNGNPGGIMIGLYPMRNAFEALWMYRGENPEPNDFRISIGVFVVHLCEVKCQEIFNRICTAFFDPNINRLASNIEVGCGVELYIENWSSLSTEAMQYIYCRLTGRTPPKLNNFGIQSIQIAEDILSAIRILQRDGFNEGVFEHEPKPLPPHFWEPIDTGAGDLEDIMFFNDNNNEDEDSDDDKSKRKRRWGKKEHKRRQPQREHKSEQRRGGTPGGPPAQVPQELVDRWSLLQLQVTPSRRFFKRVARSQITSEGSRRLIGKHNCYLEELDLDENCRY